MIMSIHVILGVTIRTPSMIKTLKRNGVTIIMVLDHDHEGEEELLDDVTYLSPNQMKDYIKENESIVFHKFMNRISKYRSRPDLL